MELVMHIELRNTTGAKEVMNQTFELPDAHSDPITVIRLMKENGRSWMHSCLRKRKPINDI